MAVEERSRRELQEALMGAIGPDPTDTLLSYLPPAGWADVATTGDVQALGAELRGEMGELRGEMGEFRGEMAELRGEMGELRGEMREMRGESTALGATLRGEIHHELRLQFYWLITLLLAIVVMLVGVLAKGPFA